MQLNNEVLQVIRSVYRLSLREMSLLLNISESHLCRIEKNKRSVTQAIRKRTIEEFGLTPEKLTQILAIYEQYTV
jgi:transcriptional regulator with XRE-family HTH domain